MMKKINLLSPFLAWLVSMGIMALSAFASAATVQFSAEITARGTETTGFEQRTYRGEFPYFDVQGGSFGGWPTREETVTFCLPQEVLHTCSIDTSRTHSDSSSWGASYGQGGPGYGIYIDSINSPGGGQSASYTLDSSTGCLTSTVAVRAKRRQRGWYQGHHEIYVRCPITGSWTNTQTQGPFSLSDSDGYTLITQYTGPIGSGAGIPGTATVANNGYSVVLKNISPANATVVHGMFLNTPSNPQNGPHLYALYDANDIEALSLEVSQGVQNIYNDMPLVAGRRALARFYVQSTQSQGNIDAQLHAYRNGIELNDSPLAAENPIIVRGEGLDRTQLDHAFLFKLPLHWTSAGDIEFRAIVNPSGMNKESDTTNNEWVENLTFHIADNTINTLVDVPLHLHQDGDRDNSLLTYEASHPTYYPIMKHVQRFHPVADSIRFDCGLKPLKPNFHGWPFHHEWDISDSDDWSKILNKIGWKRFWTACGFKESFWTGMIHPQLHNPAWGGLGRRNKTMSASRMSPTRETWTVTGGETFAHEVGHNKGLQHVCEVNDPADQDANYPYPNPCLISTGNPVFFANGHDGYFLLDVYYDYWGFDAPAILGTDEAGTVNFPPLQEARPMMSYAWGTRWISPFSYCLLLDSSGISCNADTIVQRYNKNQQWDSLIAQMNKVQDSFRQRSSGESADIIRNTTLNPLTTETLPAVKAEVANGYRVPALTASADSYLLVSGIYRISTNTVDDSVIMNIDQPPSDAALVEAQERQNKFADLAIANTGNLANVILLNQYRSQTDRTLLQTDIIEAVGIQQLDEATDAVDFLHMVERNPTASYFELVYGNTVLSQKAKSAHAPVVNINPLSSNNVDNNTVLTWEASDADGDELTYSVLYSHDNGNTWTLVDSFISGTQYAINEDADNRQGVDYFRGSNAGRFKVIAFDGFNTASDVLDQLLSVPGSKPQVSILQADGVMLSPGQSLYLSGMATDLEDGPIPSVSQQQAVVRSGKTIVNTQMTWTSSINGVIGYGPELRINSLGVGTHTITYSVRDSDGEVGSDSITVVVGKKPVRKNLAPAATASASSTYCSGSGEHCYSAAKTNDGSTNTTVGGYYSWTNGNTTLPQYLTLQWNGKMKIDAVTLYTSSGYAIQDYDLQYLADGEWITLAEVRGNTALKIDQIFPPVVTDRLRVKGLKGPANQSVYVRVNELQVFGVPLSPAKPSPLPTPTPTPTLKPTPKPTLTPTPKPTPVPTIKPKPTIVPIPLALQ